MSEGKLLLELRDAKVWRGPECIFDDISLELKLGESVALLGPNGAGKSTLMQLLTGGLRAQALPETVCRIFGEKNYSIEDLRRKIGVVTAEDLRLINASQPVEDLVLLAFRGAYGFSQQMVFSTAELEAVDCLLERFNISDLRKRALSCLSSGEKQRVLLARAMVHKPSVLIFDEPTTGLDFASAFSFIKMMSEIIMDGKTVLLITHNPTEIPPELSRCVLLKDRKVFANGKKEDVLTAKTLTELYETSLSVEFRSGWCSVLPD